MNKNFTPYIYILFLLSSFQGIFAQDFTLKLVGKDSTETRILKGLNFEPKHSSEKLVYEELDTVQKQIQKLGYFTSILESVSKDNFEITAQFSLGPKTQQIVVLIPKAVRKKYKNLFFSTKDSVSLKVFEVEEYIQSIIEELDKSGKSFSEVQLIKPKLNLERLLLELSVSESDKRMIDKVIIKGYDNFPTSFIKRYFRINSNRTFSKGELNEFSRLTKSLDFVEELKPPEVLFKQDSTIVYLFLKRSKNSSVDGILNFASKDDGSGLLINGNLDLKLKNVLNSGEGFELFWNRVKEGNSEFRLNTQIPYIFNSSFSPELSFNIYRQDSTFLTTSFRTGVGFQINEKSKVFLSYSAEDSDYLLDETTTEFDTYSKTFWDIGYSFSMISSDSKFNRILDSRIELGYGARKSSSSSNNQFRLLLDSEANISVSSRGYLNLRNKTGFLDSENFLTNELFRIGGANSVRGFNEQSIFTNQFSYLNIEYRYLTSINSYLHTITDFGFYKNTSQNRNESILGLGFGYLFLVENNMINLGYALGISPGENFDFNQSKLIIRFTSSF